MTDFYAVLEVLFKNKEVTESAYQVILAEYEKDILHLRAQIIKIGRPSLLDNKTKKEQP